MEKETHKEHVAELDKLTAIYRELSESILSAWALSHLEKEKPKSYQERVMEMLQKK